MNIGLYIDIHAAKTPRRNILAPIVIGSPSPAIDGPAHEPDNWQELGTTSVEHALLHSFNKHFVNPQSWVGQPR